MDEAVTKETLEGLELIAEVSDAGALEKIIVGTLAVLCRRTTAAAVQPHLDAAGFTDPAAGSQLYASLCALFLEGAKADVSPENIISTLDEYAIQRDASQLVAVKFGEEKEQLRWVLRRTGLRGTHIIGCDWRLDYHVRSSATGIEHVPVYFVSLKTKGSDGTLGSTDFTCSMEQMQDLLSIVRDATKQLDRILTSQET